MPRLRDSGDIRHPAFGTAGRVREHSYEGASAQRAHTGGESENSMTEPEMAPLFNCICLCPLVIRKKYLYDYSASEAELDTALYSVRKHREFGDDLHR